MMIILLNIVDGFSVDNLNVVIMEALQSGRGLTLNTITQKLVCFDVDGINTFQGSKSGGMEQVISTNYVPYFTGCIVWLIDAT